MKLVKLVVIGLGCLFLLAMGQASMIMGVPKDLLEVWASVSSLADLAIYAGFALFALVLAYAILRYMWLIATGGK